jgi:hypothetical protein
MATAYKVIAQYLNTTNATLQTAYTVPASTEIVVSSIIVCNNKNAAKTFRIAIRPNGEAINDKHYIAYDTPIAANDSITLTLGLTLDAGDIISTQSSVAGDLSFGIFGATITP